MEETTETPTESQPIKHHTRSMSQWSAILECPCYESSGGSANATKGTEVHAKLETWLNHLKEHGILPEIDRGDLDRYEYGAWMCAETVANFCPDTSILHIEEWVKIDDERGIYGKPDCYWFSVDGTLNVLDFKTFRNVGRSHFPQLAGYAVAILGKPEDLKAPVCLIVRYGDSTEVDLSYTDYEECATFYRLAMEAFDKRDNGTGTPKQCAYCDFCKHAATCGAYRQIAETVTQRQDLATAPENWNALPVERKAQLKLIAETVVKWADKITEKCKEDLLNGGVIEDAEHGIKYGLQERSGKKTPRTEDACRMLKSRGATDDDIRGALSISATGIKAVLRELGIKGKAADALIADVCDFGEPTQSIVRM